MHGRGVRIRRRFTRVASAAAGVIVLLALQPESARTGGRPAAAVQTLVFSQQAQRYLVLQFRSYATEFMGCMIGEERGGTVIVERIGPADVDPAHSRRTHVMAQGSCEQAGWVGTVGVIHSHPDGQRCWYYFPTTKVLSSDGQSFLRQPYPVDAIMCGDRIVWIGRDMVEHTMSSAAEGVRHASATSLP